ncbi:acyl-homoserine-lactone synthase [Serratia plymuthica]|uniref:acyl-homoserine-lactone synthase n=1 Tax=Serratia plymuthica TaxID=82996 RepID=UPI003DA2BAB0
MRQHRYDGILAVTSHQMLHIIKSSGWYVSLPETGISEKTSLFICCWAMWTTKVWRR